MLRLRVYTAIALAIAFISTLLLPPTWRALAISAPCLVGYWEFLSLCGLRRPLVNTLLAVLSVLLFAAIWWFQDIPHAYVELLLSSAATLWAIILLWVLGYPGSAKIWGIKYFKVAQASLLVFCTGLAIAVLSNSHQAVPHLLFIVAVVTASDIGAYFSGKQFGKHKLAVNVSPGKTWEGFGGGLALSALVALVLAYNLDSMLFLPAPSFVVLAMVCACFSVVGDLYESMIKRQVNAKDSSSLLPGHGGVLDRIDGLMPAATLYGFALLHAGT